MLFFVFSKSCFCICVISAALQGVRAPLVRGCRARARCRFFYLLHLLTSNYQGASPPSPPEGGGGESGESAAGGGGVPPLPPSLLGSGAPLAAALGELVAGAGEEEADMGRLQVTLVSPKYQIRGRRKIGPAE